MQEDFGIRVLDVSDLRAMREVGAFVTAGISVLGARLALEGTILYLVSPELSLGALDVSEPTRPQLLAQLEAPVWWARDVKVRTPLVFLADGLRGVHVLDATDPENLVPVGRAPLARAWEKPAALEIQDELVFVGSDFGGLSVLDVSDPSLPVYATR